MKYIETDLYHNFECIGGKCTDTCCAGWNIVIDKDTYEKYKQLDDGDWICRNIEQCEDGSYMISTDERGRCPFLNEDNLCDIILRKSEDYISEVCQTYPRKISKYNKTEFCTVSASCPEVARQIVERQTQIQFIMKEEEEKIEDTDKGDLFHCLMQGYFTTVEILQNKQLSLNEKYLLLLLLVEEIQVSIERNELDQIKEITEKYKRKKYRKKIIESLDNVFSMKSDHWNMISLLLKILIDSDSESKQYIYNRAIDALNLLDSAMYEQWKQHYKKVEVLQEKENLAVQFMFEYFMDALNKKSLYNNLAKMYVMMVYIEIFEIYVYNKEGNLGLEDRIKIISELSRIMEHTMLLDCICDELMEENRTLNLIRLLGCIM